MGCIFGKTSTGATADEVEGREGKGGPDRPSSQSAAAGDGARRRHRHGKHPAHSQSVNAAKRDNTLEKRQHGKAYFYSSSSFPAVDFRRSKLDPHATTHQGWPAWLAAVAGEAINDFTPRRANTFEKLEKIGQGTYSNVYKARDLLTGKIVALKKVRFDSLEPESVRFMAREILVLRRLDHPNVIKLEGLVTSRMSSSLYLIFEYMEHDLSGLAASLGGGAKFSEAQVKCYVKQLLSGLEHCHNNGVLHRDIKGSNLLLDNNGILKIADFGLAAFYDPDSKKQQPLTSRVVTLWYRPPELLLGAVHYDVGVDLWSAGCILAELLAGKPILPGRTEVEQLHKIFKLCGSPSDEYWKKYKLPNATLFKPQQPYKRRVAETFKDFPSCSLSLVESLLSIDPLSRETATAALNSEFFATEPYACEPSSLPKYPPSKEMDVKLKDEAARRQRGHVLQTNAGDGVRRSRMRDRASSRAVPAPEANAEIQSNVDRLKVVNQGNGKSKSEKFPPPHQDGAVGVPVDKPPNAHSLSFDPADGDSFDTSDLDPKNTSHLDPKRSKSIRSIAALKEPSRRMENSKEELHHKVAPSRKFVYPFKPSSIGLSLDMMFKRKKRTQAS